MTPHRQTLLNVFEYLLNTSVSILVISFSLRVLLRRYDCVLSQCRHCHVLSLVSISFSLHTSLQ
ncbi:hypothetical protein K443DRAFT_475974 [Laccaria amethystina LaAM-08-1]|uniref:Uncharacterized protein n=1 Tax=Laccaria amethystina LaAM-08-1 TaxID=1095629 RepID=A0A0C9XEV0_9AGAR|nr:hypothetical protein K443DRAFT_475974 [Laccaria amethystina LaAM-08-1]